MPCCAYFVSWCADQCGYIKDGIIPKFAGVGTAEDFFKARGQWADWNYVPSPGDIIFFDWAENDGKPDGFVDHVGLVERVSDNIVYTIEGNNGDRCVCLHYAVGDYEIYGYGIPQYLKSHSTKKCRPSKAALFISHNRVAPADLAHLPGLCKKKGILLCQRIAMLPSSTP